MPSLTLVDSGRKYHFEPFIKALDELFELPVEKLLHNFWSLESHYKRIVNRPKNDALKEQIVSACLRYDGEYFRRSGLHILPFCECSEFIAILQNRAWSLDNGQ